MGRQVEKVLVSRLDRWRSVALSGSGQVGDRAISVNVEIMREFVQLRKMLISNDALARRLHIIFLHNLTVMYIFIVRH